MEGSETGGAWMGTGVGEGRLRGARLGAQGWGWGWGGKMEGSETGAAWVGMGLGKEDGARAQAHGRGWGWGGKIEGSETGGAWVGGAGEGRGSAERDGRRVGGDETREGRWRGARRELAAEVHKTLCFTGFIAYTERGRGEEGEMQRRCVFQGWCR